MTTIHFAVDEKLAEAAKQKASAAGKTLDVWLADIVAVQLRKPEVQHWVANLIDASEHLAGNSHGQKWTRAELYDE
jgi:hypothetical protein